MKPRSRLGRLLDAVYAQYHRPELLGTDPLSAPHRYRDPRDQEVTGFIAAGLAFGNVRMILASVERALVPLGERPAHALAHMDLPEAERVAAGFNHRWVRDHDLAQVYVMVGAALREAGGLEPLFAGGMSGDLPDVRPGAIALLDSLVALSPQVDPTRRGTRSFLPNIAGPVACKRVHMFLRWMIRRDELDLGIWTSARPEQLLVPVDTHVARISRYLGLTNLKTAGASMATEITRNLARFDPDDPVKYDFALSRLGILRDCPTRRDAVRCNDCQLVEACCAGTRQ